MKFPRAFHTNKESFQIKSFIHRWTLIRYHYHTICDDHLFVTRVRTAFFSFLIDYIDSESTDLIKSERKHFFLLIFKKDPTKMRKKCTFHSLRSINPRLIPKITHVNGQRHKHEQKKKDRFAGFVGSSAVPLIDI